MDDDKGYKITNKTQKKYDIRFISREENRVKISPGEKISFPENISTYYIEILDNNKIFWTGYIPYAELIIRHDGVYNRSYKIPGIQKSKTDQSYLFIIILVLLLIFILKLFF